MRKQLTKPPYNCRTLILHIYIYIVCVCIHIRIHTCIHTYMCVCVCHVVTLHSKELPNKINLDHEAPNRSA